MVSWFEVRDDRGRLSWFRLSIFLLSLAVVCALVRVLFPPLVAVAVLASATVVTMGAAIVLSRRAARAMAKQSTAVEEDQ